jgi:integrase
MEGKETERKPVNHRSQFIAVRDSRNRRVPGLYIRNDRYYAQLWMDPGNGRKSARRFPLRDQDGQPVRSLLAAKDAVLSLRESRKRNALPKTGAKPTFANFVRSYLETALTSQKRKGTQDREAASLELWCAHFGSVRIDRITTPMIKEFVELRLRGCTLRSKRYDPVSPRTVAIDMIALRNVLNAAIDADHIRELPRFPRLSVPPPLRRPLLTPAEFQKLLRSCAETKPNGEALTKNGKQLHDYLNLLAFTGAREKEALRLRWSHVDFERRRIFIGAPEDFVASAVTIGSGGTSKNRGSRMVDFNPQLEALLKEMYARRAPDSGWLFPSSQRGQKDIHAKTLRESFNLVRHNADLLRVGFHDLRHLFCSFCVMAGVDFMTIAEWLGHKDGGILIGKVYGHLLDEHRQKMAAKVRIGITSKNGQT